MNDSGLGITKENLLLIVPPALTRDPAMMARAAADAEAMAARLAEIDRVRIISNIDGLDETVLDILARDFKVDWWDPEYSIEEKRRTLKGSWRVHKILGTKAAVETAIRAIYPLTTVEEWFEYGGEPYHFRLNIDITSDSGDRARQKRVLERLNFYKSLRSHNDGVRYFLVPEKSWALAGGLFAGSSFSAVLSVLKTAKTIEAASNAVLLKFERPANQGEAVKLKRVQYGQVYYDKFAAKQAAEGGPKMNKKPVSFLQTDKRWASKPYRVKGENSTIGDSGCGPTAAAMLLSTLTGKNITPEDTCKWSVDHGYKALGNGTYS